MTIAYKVGWFPKVGEHYGEVNAALERSGVVNVNHDLWIAAHARAEDEIFVTHDTKEFARIPNLIVEDWTR